LSQYPFNNISRGNRFLRIFVESCTINETNMAVLARKTACEGATGFLEEPGEIFASVPAREGN
jgi:hypothetical protein